jgi:hypothetical protein
MYFFSELASTPLQLEKYAASIERVYRVSKTRAQAQLPAPPSQVPPPPVNRWAPTSTACRVVFSLTPIPLVDTVTVSLDSEKENLTCDLFLAEGRSLAVSIVGPVDVCVS